MKVLPFFCLVERDHALLRAVVKVLVKQNNLLLLALTGRQQVESHDISEEFRFPMNSEDDLTRVEEPNF